MVTEQRGPRPTRQASLARSAGQRPSSIGSLAPAATSREESSGVGDRGGKGPLRPWAHQELAGEVDGARGGPVAAQSAAAELGSVGRNGDGGGVSGDHDPIPAARMTREARRSSWDPWSRSGRRQTAAGGDGCGGELAGRKSRGRERDQRGGED
jgi:hypothetical protein